MEVIREWAGKERLFRLTFGSVLDVEQACGDGIGHVFIRVANGQFRATDVYHVIKLALVAGGESIVDAKRLMDNHFDTRPYMENAALAGDILATLMVGVEHAPREGGSVPEPHKFSDASQICRVFNMSPQELRDMRYPDFVNILKGWRSSDGKHAAHLTEDEFLDILNRYEPVGERA